MPSSSVTKLFQLIKIFWWSSAYNVRIEGFIRLAFIVGVQLFRGQASTFLSGERRRRISTITGGATRGIIFKGIVRYVIFLLILSPIDKIYWRLLRGLRQQWKRHLTGHLLENFIDVSCLGSLRHPLSHLETGKRLESSKLPDQRIAKDVGIFVDLCTSLSLETLQATIHLYFNVLLLRSTTKSKEITFAVFAAAALGSLCTGKLGNCLVHLYEKERDADSQFKYCLTRMRENAESIAFYGGQEHEVMLASQKLDARLASKWERLWHKDYVQLFSKMFRQLAGLFPAILLAGVTSTETVRPSGNGTQPHDHSAHHNHSHDHHGHGHSHGNLSQKLVRDSYGQHRNIIGDEARSGGSKVYIDLGLLTQAQEAFDEVLYHLMILAENCSDFSRLTTVVTELHSYYLQNQQQRAHSGGVLHLPFDSSAILPCLEKSSTNSSVSSVDAQWLQCQDLTLWAPGSRQSRVLVKSLNFNAPAHGGLLVSGSSGAGKTTLLRAIAGLWKNGTGFIRREMRRRRICFLPQKPYMVLGTLRDQLLYPFPQAEVEDIVLCGILRRLGLGHVLMRFHDNLDVVRRWDEELSLGEQQRIAVARILVHRPDFAILDEATSANDERNEAAMYKCIAATCQAYISVGHRPSIQRFHVRQLRLYGEQQSGTWELQALPVSGGGHD